MFDNLIKYLIPDDKILLVDRINVLFQMYLSAKMVWETKTATTKANNARDEAAKIHDETEELLRESAALKKTNAILKSQAEGVLRQELKEAGVLSESAVDEVAQRVFEMIHRGNKHGGIAEKSAKLAKKSEGGK